MNYRLFIGVLLLLFGNPSEMAAGSTELSSSDDSQKLRKITEGRLFIDESKKLTFEEVQEKEFKPFSGGLNFGFSDAAYWVKLDIRNTSATDDWKLLIRTAYIDFLDYRVLKNGQTINEVTTGWSKPFDTRGKREHVGFVFDPELKPGSTAVIFLRFESKSPLYLPLELIRQEKLDRSFQAENIYYGIFFGAVIVMILYNFFVYTSLRDSDYLLYIATLFCTLIVFSGSSGYLFAFLHPDFPEFNNYLTRVFMGFLGFFTGIFAMSFLNLKQHHRFFYRIMLISSVSALVSTVLTATDLYPPATNSQLTLHSPLLIIAGIIAYRRGNKAARFYILAWLLYVSGGVFITLRNAGVMPGSMFIDHAVEVGALCEAILLSLALADRYRILRKEKEVAVKNALSAQEKANIKLEAKVRERTTEIRERNEELDTTLHTVKLQNQEIEYHNNQIQSGIAYAKSIQDSILPSQKTLKSCLADHFIFYLPRDMVSGDFYFVRKNEERIILAVSDCTGHGVPGAFMSMMGINLFARIYSENSYPMPNEALSLLNRYLTDTLDGEEKIVRDGMDTAVCMIDRIARKLYFSGTKLPLLMIRNGEAQLFKGENLSIGGTKSFSASDLKVHEIDFKETDCFFMYSDGYQDQFGGPKGKKFMSRRFRELLLENSVKPFCEQREILSKELKKWQAEGHEKQTDDILVIGFKP